MAELTSLPVASGNPSKVTPSEWDTWMARGAAVEIEGRGKFFLTKAADGTPTLTPVAVVEDCPKKRPW